MFLIAVFKCWNLMHIICLWFLQANNRISFQNLVRKNVDTSIKINLDEELKFFKIRNRHNVNVNQNFINSNKQEQDCTVYIDYKYIECIYKCVCNYTVYCTVYTSTVQY